MLQYSVVALPKLDNQDQFQELRERYDPLFYQIRPHIALVPPFTPATLGELESVGEYISQARRHMHPVAISFHEYLEEEDRILCPVDKGKEELQQLHRNLHGSEVLSLVDREGYEPRLVVSRIPEPARRKLAIAEIRRLGRTLGIIDALSLIGIEQGGDLKLVASYPFGVGRVDYFDEFLA